MVVLVTSLLAACPGPVTEDRTTFGSGTAAGFAPTDAGLTLSASSSFDDAGAPPAQTGRFTSRVLDFGQPETARTVQVSTTHPAGRPLPVSRGRDVGVTRGGIDMTGNALLFPFDEPAGATTVVDRSGNGHVGVHDGGLAFGVRGVANQAMANDSGCVFVPSAPSLHPLDQLTLAAWIRPTGLDGVEPHGIVAKRADYLVQSEYTFFIWQGDRLWVDLDSEDDRFGGNAIIENDRWTHVAMVYDGRLDAGVRVRLFVDGQLDVVAPETSATLTPQNVPVAVGCLPNPGGGLLQPFTGALDEVAIWHRALSDLEVQSLYARGASRHELALRPCVDALCTTAPSFTLQPPGATLLFTPARYFQYQLHASAPPGLLEWSTVTSVTLDLACDGGVALDAGVDGGLGEDGGAVDAGAAVDGGQVADAGPSPDGGAAVEDGGAGGGVAGPEPDAGRDVERPRQLEVRFGCTSAPGLLMLLAPLALRLRRRGS